MGWPHSVDAYVRPGGLPGFERGSGVMNVLVAYASRHGATAGIAERIAAGLRSAGLRAEAIPVKDVADVGSYDAFVVGGSAYMFHWAKDAVAFVQRYRDELRKSPVWLFSSGPLGTDRVDKDGRDVLESSRPKEFDDLVAMVRPRGERVFFGAYDPTVPPIGLGERLIGLMPAARDALPAGDFRDWPVIDGWALEIAAGLVSGEAAAE